MRLEVRQPILTNEDLEKVRVMGQQAGDAFRSVTLDITWPVREGADGMEKAIDALCAEAIRRVEEGVNILILSDRMIGPDRVAIPALLATSAVHHHLVREGKRTETGLVIETGEAPRGPSVLRARRLRCRGDQSLSRLRNAGRDAAVAARTGQPVRTVTSATSRGSTRPCSR